MNELKVTIRPPEIIISPSELGVFYYDLVHNSFTISPDLIKNLDVKEMKNLFEILVRMTVKVV